MSRTNSWQTKYFTRFTFAFAGREIQRISPTYGQLPHHYTSQVPEYLTETVSKMLDAAVSKNTQKSYKTARSVYEKYFLKIYHSSPIYPSSIMHILYFVSWLHDQKKPHNTISTYLAGNSYHHRIRELPGPTQFFIIKKFIKGAQRLSGTPDVRLPITPNILHKLVKSLHFTASEKYTKRLLRAIFTLSFFAFLRRGEISAKPSKTHKNIIQFHNLTVDESLGQKKSHTLTLRHLSIMTLADLYVYKYLPKVVSTYAL